MSDNTGTHFSCNCDRCEQLAVTDKQIRALRAEAIAHGDYAQADICDRALTADGDTLDQDGNEIALAEMTQHEAREECARVISAGRG